MKSAVYILSIAVAILIFLFLRERNVNANSKEYIKQKQEEIKTIHRERDSLHHVVSLAMDAMDAKDLEITRAHEEFQKSEIRGQKWKIKYESMRFKPYTNHQRDSVWTALYPAWDSIR